MPIADKIGQVLLYVIRHANVAADAKGTMRGMLNPALDDKGKKQSLEAEEYFKDVALSWIATDDLKRTEQTALPIADDKGLEVECDIGLRSWDIGPDFEGKSIDKYEDDIIRLKTQPWLIPAGGQSWQSYEDQVDESFNRYINRGMDSAMPGAIVVHGSYIQVVSVKLGYMEKQAEYDCTPVEPSGIIGVYLTRNGLQMKVLRGEKAGVKDE